MIELNKVYKDRRGNDVRIICVDRKHPTHTIIGLVSYGSKTESISSFTEDGRFYYPGNSSDDLILPEDYSTYIDGEPVMVRINDESTWFRAYFAGVQDGKPTAWANGVTSWTRLNEPAIAWNQCRRPTKEELES